MSESAGGPSMKICRIAPIDIDFAGWTEVVDGQHNAWGVIDANGGLRSWASTHIGAQNLLAQERSDQRQSGSKGNAQ